MPGGHRPTAPSSPYLSSIVLPSCLPSPTIKRQRNSIRSFTSVCAVPTVPAAWTWTCHQCHHTYPLGATRRCLHDGHRFCAGVSIDRRTGKPRRHKACGSTFDYAGWKTFNAWREEMLAASITSTPTGQSFGPSIARRRNKSFARDKEEQLVWSTTSDTKNCEKDCKFPSECRWNPRPLKTSVKKASEPVAVDNAQDHSQRTQNVSDTQLTLKSAKPTSPENICSPVSPLSPSPTGTSHNIQSLAEVDYRAPVLDFAAFKARLDRAGSRVREEQEQEQEQERRRQQQQQQQQNHTWKWRQDLHLELPELNFGGSILMDVDAISPPDELPENKGIQVAIPIREGRLGRTGDNEKNLSSCSDKITSDPEADNFDSGDPMNSGSKGVVYSLLALGSCTDEKAMDSGRLKCKGGGVPPVTTAWDWSIGGLGAADLTGMDLAGAIDISEDKFQDLIERDCQM